MVPKSVNWRKNNVYKKCSKDISFPSLHYNSLISISYASFADYKIYSIQQEVKKVLIEKRNDHPSSSEAEVETLEHLQGKEVVLFAS